MNGAQQAQQLTDAGFSPEEVRDWSAQQRAQLTSAGFGDAEVNAWFGEREPNLTPFREQLRKNLVDVGATDEAASAVGMMAEKGLEQVGAIEQAAVKPEFTAAQRLRLDRGDTRTNIVGQKPARTFEDALEAGLQISVTGLMARGKEPGKVLSEDAPMASRIAANVGTMIGDLPWMTVGAVLGGAGGVETGPGAAVTAMGGAFAVPAGLRATLIDSYRNGEFKSFGDFWDRASGIIWEEAKGWMTGATMGGAGVLATARTVAAPAMVRAFAPTAAEIATMVTVGRALDGQMPTATDFIDAAVILGGAKIGVRGAKSIERRLQDVYVRTGATPREILDQAAKDPTVLPEIVSDNAAERAALPELSDAQLEAASGGAAVAPPAAAPAPAARPASSPEPDASQQAVLDRVSVGEREKRTYTFDRFYSDMKDELYPIRVLVDNLAAGQSVPASKDAYKLAREARGVAGKAEQFLEISPFKFDTYENVGKSLKAIVAPVKNDLDGLRAYAVARRAIELDGRGIETGVPLEEALAVVRDGKKYEAVHRELLEFQRHATDYLVDSGLVSAEGAAAMREANQDYVPFFRLMDDGAGGAKGAGPGMSVRSPIKAIKGSERKIIDPLESIVKNTYLYTTLAERNAARMALVDLAEASGRDELVKRVAAPSKPIEVQAKEVQDFLDAHGIQAEGEAFTIFRRGFMNPAENEMVVYRAGKREVYEVPRDVAAAFEGLDREAAGFLTRILAIPAKTLRAGATLAPDFMLRNINRDQLSAAVFSDNNYVPFLDFARGFLSLANRDREFQLWLKAGGANATLLSMDRQYLQESVWKLADMSAVQQKVWNVVRAPWMEKPKAAGEAGAQVIDTILTPLKITSELLENATRLGEFKKGLKGETSKEAAQEAAFGAREVTLDFARIGAKTRAMNMITAFWNAQVEGVDRAARAFKDNPMRTSAKMLAYITGPSLLLWWANHDDPRWKEIPDWERDLFWIVMTKDHVYRIPKPFELGVIFGSIPERLLDKFVDEKPEAAKGLGSSMVKAFTPGIMPTFATPLLEHMTNHSFFTDRPLVPDNLEKLLPEYQYSPYTTEATKALGHMIGTIPGAHDKSFASPTVIDNYVRGWSGTMGVYAIQIADAALRKSGVLPDPVKPTATLADMPVIKAFVVRYPSAQAQSIADFNEHYKASKMVVDTVQYLAKQGEPEAALREANLDPVKLIKLDSIHEAIANAHRVIQLVEKNPNFSADEKRQLIDTTYTQMIDMAREGEGIVREITKELGPKFGKEAKGAANAAAVH